ncbi:anthranilate phosphoribosyltransferase [Pleomorphomonas koreensis]|uniref:anthranilate phosphoribosyltransferase n=1 Tax=Pleomorphomonas koreensis TaxID=257440 RepID=UPI0003FF6C0E|nr:anthranilate phosphoribosyltransferase [Pleomorphomonas koreensis]
MADFKTLIAKVAAGSSLSREEATLAFDIMMTGEATPSQIGGFLMALRVRGETVEEIAGAVSSMRSRMLRVEAPVEAVDIVGTGGDASGSLNISTASAFVAAGAGLAIAKHGNRALSSKSGAADVLMALGVRIDIGPEVIAACIREAGIGFMFAPVHHSAMKHVGPSRVELGTRTIFNILGPLSNPAGVRRQLVGVFAREWLVPVAETLAALGSQSVWVVHGSGGLDEMTLSGPTHVAELKDGHVRAFDVMPDDVGLPHHSPEAVHGGSAEDNAAALRALLDGAAGAYRDTVMLNVAAALVIADRAPTLKDGVTLAADSIDSGRARAALDRLVACSNA